MQIKSWVDMVDCCLNCFSSLTRISSTNLKKRSLSDSLAYRVGRYARLNDMLVWMLCWAILHLLHKTQYLHMPDSDSNTLLYTSLKFFWTFRIQCVNKGTDTINISFDIWLAKLWPNRSQSSAEHITNHYNPDMFVYKPWRLKGFFPFEIIINVFCWISASFEFSCYESTVIIYFIIFSVL